MPETFQPPKNLVFLMLVLHMLKEVSGKAKLMKIHWLIEQEGHVRFDQQIGTDFPLGPIDFPSFDFADAEGLIEHAQYKKTLKITNKGEKFFDDICKPLISKSEFDQAGKIIERYKNTPGYELIKYIHSKYIDKFKEPKFREDVYKDTLGKVNVLFSIIHKRFLETKDIRLFDAEGQLIHIKRILEHVKTNKEAGKIGAVLLSIKDYLSGLEEKGYTGDMITSEFFEFLDNYCDKEGIYHSVASEDFSDINEGDRQRLIQTINQIQIPAS